MGPEAEARASLGVCCTGRFGRRRLRRAPLRRSMARGTQTAGRSIALHILPTFNSQQPRTHRAVPSTSRPLARAPSLLASQKLPTRSTGPEVSARPPWEVVGPFWQRARVKLRPRSHARAPAGLQHVLDGDPDTDHAPSRVIPVGHVAPPPAPPTRRTPPTARPPPPALMQQPPPGATMPGVKIPSAQENGASEKAPFGSVADLTSAAAAVTAPAAAPAKPPAPAAPAAPAPAANGTQVCACMESSQAPYYA